MEERVYKPITYVKDKMKHNCGIYQIRNIVNNHFYIGSSHGFQRRWAIHLNSLKIGRHENKYLQRAYNKYGKDNFVLEIIEFCEPENRFELEQYWINRFFGTKGCYNLNPLATCPPIRYGNKPNITKEQRKNISESKKKYFIEHEEERYRLSNWAKEHMTGKNNPSARAVACLETGMIFDTTKDASRFIGVDRRSITSCCIGHTHTVKKLHWMYKEEYEKLTTEEIENIIYAEHNGNIRKCICIEDGKIFKSLADAAKFYDVSSCNISMVCRGKQKSVGGYHFKYVD